MKSGKIVTAVIAVVMFASACTPGKIHQPASPTSEPATPAAAAQLIKSGEIALVNGVLVDGTGGEPVPDAVVVIQDGRITSAGPRSAAVIPEGAAVIDVEGAAILPGFINAHVHEGFNPANLQAWAVGGVTTVRDESARGGELADLIGRRDSEFNRPQLARLISAGRMITRPDGYGSAYVEGAEEARQQVVEQLAAGADMLKISQENGYAGRTGLPVLDEAEIMAVIETAHRYGKRVSAHITQAKYMEIVVDAGVDDVAHMSYDRISDSLIEKMVKKDIYLTPTFSVLKDYDAIGSSVENLRRLVAAGGKIALGNDYAGGRTLDSFELGIPMYEIEMMAKAGMTPMQIITAATKNAAHVCGRETDLGTLEVGKIADVLVINGNPLRDLQSLKNIRMVIKDGVIIRQ